ncbi:MAG: pentapeptide repeat-containing protein [Bacteroidales bacterium]|nr:pentapeptide repeat-containing protein [Bacteroidales bacterium]
MVDRPLSATAPVEISEKSIEQKQGSFEEKKKDLTSIPDEIIPTDTITSKSEDNGDDKKEALAETLKTLMKKGAKEWNKYRKEHPGELFDEALKESNLSGFDLSSFDLSNLNLKEATLINTNFKNCNMTGVNIKEANVQGAVFENANLTGADMKELVMNGNNLKNAVLKGANLKEITLTNCDLTGAVLTGCNLSEAVIENCTFKGAVLDHTTMLPPGFDATGSGLKFE